MEKKLRSEYTVRFGDCDLFGHLNNARYLDYFLNAREDHLKTYYDMDLRSFYKEGISWLVGGHEIVYLRPAQYNERVVIYSALFHASDDVLWVELIMMDEKESHFKSVMWTRFVPVNVKTGKKENHPPSFMDFANQVTLPGIELSAGLQERLKVLIGEVVRAKATA